MLVETAQQQLQYIEGEPDLEMDRIGVDLQHCCCKIRFGLLPVSIASKHVLLHRTNQSNPDKSDAYELVLSQ